MSSPSGSKVCVVCGIDCSNKPRTKDAQGRYTCRSCFAAVAAKPKQARPVQQPEASDEEAVMAALLASSPGPAAAETCPACGNGMAPGAVLCLLCGHNKHTGQTAGVRIEKGPGAGSAVLAAASTVGGAAKGPAALVLATVFGVICGLVGAAVWAAIAYNTGYEIGWIAWGVGAAVGFGCALGARGHSGTMTGIIAAAIALFAVMGGKYAAVSMIIDEVVHKQSLQKHAVSDEEVVSIVARTVAAEHREAGKNYQWPDGVDQATPMGEEEFPAPVWKEASTRWEAMDQGAKDEYRSSVQERYNRGLSRALEEAKTEGFVAMLSPFDLLWLFLALGSAFSIGSSGDSGGGGSDD